MSSCAFLYKGGNAFYQSEYEAYQPLKWENGLTCFVNNHKILDSKVKLSFTS